MKAAVYRGVGDLRIEELPVPEVGNGEMLVRVDVCGVCVTDVKKIQKGLVAPPRIFGHEISGTVARVGSGVSGFREGQHVVLHHHVPCGSCFYCARGAHAQCPLYKKTGTTAGYEPAGGGFAEYVKAFDWIVARGAIAVPEGVSPEEAAFVEPVNTCLKAVRHGGVDKGQTVLVVGQGPIGLLLTQLARWAGAEVLASDPMPDRRAMSLRLGASTALDARGDVVDDVRAVTGGRGADCTFLAALGTDALRTAIRATRPAGRIIVFAATAPGEKAEIDLGELCVQEKEILTSYSSSPDIQDLAAQLVFAREIRVRELITHRMPLAKAKAAVDLASHPSPGVLKIVLEIGAGARS